MLADNWIGVLLRDKANVKEFHVNSNVAKLERTDEGHGETKQAEGDRDLSTSDESDLTLPMNMGDLEQPSEDRLNIDEIGEQLEGNNVQAMLEWAKVMLADIGMNISDVDGILSKSMLQEPHGRKVSCVPMVYDMFDDEDYRYASENIWRRIKTKFNSILDN